MDIQKVNTPKGISNYLSDYIVKGIKGDLEEKSYGFKYFERRYSISRSCIRPVKPYPTTKVDLSLSLEMKFREKKLDWILYNLLKIEEDTIIKFTEDKKDI